jgi:hypothetical protein
MMKIVSGCISKNPFRWASMYGMEKTTQWKPELGKFSLQNLMMRMSQI